MTYLERIAEMLGDVVAHTGGLAPAVLFLAAFAEHVFPPFPGDLLGSAPRSGGASIAARRGRRR